MTQDDSGAVGKIITFLSFFSASVGRRDNDFRWSALECSVVEGLVGG